MRVQSDLVTLPASSTFSAYRRVMLTSGVIAYAGANDIEYGVLNQAVLSGDTVGSVVHRDCPGTVRMVAASAITQYADVYAAASGKVNDVVSPVYIGVAMTAAGADGDWIEVLRIKQPSVFQGVVGPSTAISNTTTETAFDKSVALAANSLKVGDVIRTHFQGIATATNSTDTLAVKLYVGTVNVLTIAAVNATDNDIFYGFFDTVIRTIGASGTLVGCGISAALGATGGAAITAYKASTTVDTTAALDVSVKATWSVASASNSCRLDVLNVSVLRG